jgi:PAS domain S-box-containing protein
MVVAGLLTHQARHRQVLEPYWRDIIDLADEGFWLIDATATTRMVNHRMASLLGYAPSDMLGRTPFDLVVDEDRSILEHQIGANPGGGLRHTEPGPRQYEIRLRHRDGHAVTCLVHATALRDARGVVSGSFAFMTDITELRRRERELHLSRHALDHCFDEVYRINRDGCILGANRAACENLGYYRSELLGSTVGDIDPNYPPEAWTEHWHELERRGALTQETVHRTREGWEYPVEVAERYLVYDGEPFAFGVAREVRARNAAEASARRANEALRALSRANAALSQATDENDLFRRVCEALTSSRGYPLAWVGLVDDEADGSIKVSAAAGDAQPYLERRHVVEDNGPLGPGPTGKAIRTGEIQVLRDVDPDFASWHESATEYGFRTSVSLPIRVDDRIIGALNVYSAEPWAFDERELPLLEELAADLGFGVRTMEIRADRDRQLARLRLAGTVFDNRAEGILIADANQPIEMVNRAFTHITGYEAYEVIGHRPPMEGPAPDARHRSSRTRSQPGPISLPTIGHHPPAGVDLSRGALTPTYGVDQSHRRRHRRRRRDRSSHRPPARSGRCHRGGRGHRR